MKYKIFDFRRVILFCSIIIIIIIIIVVVVVVILLLLLLIIIEVISVLHYNRMTLDNISLIMAIDQIHY
jgi:hypothetical protein